MANKLKKDYEEENNFTYDCVIRARFDLHYNTPIIINDYIDILKDKIVVPKNYQDDQDKFSKIEGTYPFKPMVDIFAFSSSKNMDIFCSVFPNLKNINTEIHHPFGEVYLGYNTRIKNNVHLHKAPFDLTILQRMGIV